MLGVPLRAERQAARNGGEKLADVPRRAVRLRPSIPSGQWARILAILEQPAAARSSAWRMLAENVRDVDRGASAVALVLSDLHSQGWGMTAADSEVWALPPAATVQDGERPEVLKQRQRGFLQVGRAFQLADEAVRAFLAKMETRRRFAGRRVSVLDLVDDGKSLSAALRTAALAPPSERDGLPAKIIQPSLHIVDSDVTCPETGLPLTDVWRYFRHTWSLEYRPTPGRVLYFLIRNSARPHAPVMAIGALANATLQMRVREEWIGWSAQAMREAVERDPITWPMLRARLLSAIRDDIENVRSDDLLHEIGTADGAERERRLLAVADAAKRQRESEMQERRDRIARGETVDPIRRLPTDASGAVSWHTAAESTLFRAKRAKALADLYFAERILSREDLPPDALRSDAEVARAFSLACKELRKVGLASRLLELNVCGAVPPYGDLLAGKLAAVAVASEELVRAYAERYATKVSEITSQMAGRPIVRSAEACVVTTTSLYGFAASQYNRLRLQVPDDEGRTRTVAWCDLGQTEGYGTTQFLADTVDALRALSIERRGGRRVNNLFGEGQSPRLRQVREALDDLGLDSDGLLRHSQPRRVYALELFPGARDCLRTNGRASATQPSFAAIARQWTTRWLSQRVKHRPALDRVAQIGPESVRRDLTSLGPSSVAPSIGTELLEPEHDISPQRMVLMPSTSNTQLIQTLYRAAAACADHHDPATVRLLHIETRVDEFLRERAKMGGVVFVTGNPGDGKTHILRRLEAELKAEKVDVHLDANEESPDELLGAIDGALKRKSGGIAIAINEGILVSLLRDAGDRAWAHSARELLMHPYIYPGRPSRDVLPQVAVVDLNLRNNLAPEIVKAALRRLLDQAAPCDGCPQKTCGLQANAARLQGKGPGAERLVALLDAIARGGFHATMRDVQGFLAYVLSGASDCDAFKEGKKGAAYWDAVFDGGYGPLFDAVRERDPSTHTAPLLDDVLWRGCESPTDWWGESPDPPASVETLDERRSLFVTKKRRALFEHEAGQRILADVESPAERAVRDTMKPGTAAVRRLVALLNRFFDRDEDQSEVLHLWVTHRYDAQPNRFAATRHGVPAVDLEVLVPQLREEIAPAFPDFRPRFAVLCSREQRDPREGLRIDRNLLTALLAAEQGLPTSFRRGEPEARIASFFDRLTKLRGDRSEGHVEVKLVDMDTGANLKVGVNLDRASYERLGSR